MLKLIAKKSTAFGHSTQEELFLDGEKDFAVARAAKLDSCFGYVEVLLIETTQGRGKVPVVTRECFLNDEGNTEIKTVTTYKKAVAKFSFVKFVKPVVKPKRVAKVIAASVEAFDLPPAPKPKRLTKRQRDFGVEAGKTLALAE